MSLANIEQCYGENKALAAFNTELCVSWLCSFSSIWLFLDPQACRYQGSTVFDNM
jgi:hypothetical protein